MEAVVKKYLLIITFFLFLTNCFAQKSSLYIPRNIQQAYEKGTRSSDGKPGTNYWQNFADYKINVELFPDEMIIKGNEEIIYKNNNPEKLTRLIFRLYPNIFKKGNSREIELPEEEITEGVKITLMIINGDTVNLNPSKNAIRLSGTNLIVKLKNPLETKSETKIVVEWNYKVNKGGLGRTGIYNKTTFMVGYFYPQVAVLDDVDGWDRIDYRGVVEFYEGFGNFDVNITVPDRYAVWATGILQNAEDVLSKDVYKKYQQAKSSGEIINVITKQDLEKGNVTKSGKSTWQFKANYVPDFVFTAGKELLWDASTLKLNNGNEVLISSIYNQNLEKCEEIAQLAKTGIDYFSNESPGILYPYPAMTVFTHEGGGGMEFPMMVNDGWGYSREDMVETLLHEIFHTYFPFYMGTNQRKYAWMDEGWAVMMIFDLVKELVPESDSRNKAGIILSQFMGNNIDLPLMTPSHFTAADFSTYAVLSYTKSAIAYEILKDMLGADLFKKCLQEYIKRWNGKHPIPYDFFNTFNEVAGQNLDWFWQSWFFENGFADLEIKEIDEKNNPTQIIIEKKGNLPTPIYLKVIYEDNSSEEIIKQASIWKNGEKYCKLDLKFAKKIKSAELFNKMVPDVVTANNKIVLIKEKSDANLNDYVGKFNIPDISMVVDITVENEKLYAQPAGQPKFELEPTSDYTFEIPMVGVKVKFIRNENKKVNKFILIQNGKEFSGERI